MDRSHFWKQLALAILVGLTQFARTVAEEPDTKFDQTTMATLRVVLKGEDGQPVAGAAVMPYAMRVVEQRGHGYWNRDKLGHPQDYMSNAQGIATIRYPAKVDAKPEPWTTKLITFQIRHTDFVKKIVHFDLGDPDNPDTETEVELKRGCEIQLSAVDANGNQIPDFGVMIAGRNSPDFWTEDKGGGRRCGSINDGNWQTMLVKPQLSGKTLFSSLVPLRVRPNQAVRIRNVKLRPGSKLAGKLSENVPRPIKNGRVITTTVPEPDNNAWDEESPSLLWHESVEIQADGTFQLLSIPRQGEIQIVAVCEGWVSSTNIPEARSFVMGQLFRVDQKQLDVVVDMERTGTVEVTLTKPDGSPLESGKIGSWPNQRFYKGGSTLLGQRLESIVGIRNQLRSADEQVPEFERTRELAFMECDINDGVAVIRGLPQPSKQYVVLQHDDYRLAAAVGETRVAVESTGVTKVTLKVVPHEQTAAADLLDGLNALLDKGKKTLKPKNEERND